MLPTYRKIVEILDQIDAFHAEINEEKSSECMEKLIFLAEEYFGDYLNSIFEKESITGKEYIDILEEMCEKELEGINFMHLSNKIAP